MATNEMETENINQTTPLDDTHAVTIGGVTIPVASPATSTHPVPVTVTIVETSPSSTGVCSTATAAAVGLQTSAVTVQSRSRSSRDRRMPAHFQDFVIDHHPSTSGRTDEHSVVTTQTSRSRRSSHSSNSLYSGQSRHSKSSFKSILSDSQSAKLKQQRKQAELEEMKRQIEEDQSADEELQRLDDEAYAARIHADEEALAARRRAEEIERNAFRQRESLNTRLSRQRRLREVEQQLNEARLITAMVNSDPEPEIEKQHQTVTPSSINQTTLSDSPTQGQTITVSAENSHIANLSDVPTYSNTAAHKHKAEVHVVDVTTPAVYSPSKVTPPSMQPAVTNPYPMTAPTQSVGWAPPFPNPFAQPYPAPSHPMGPAPAQMMMPNSTEMLIASSYGIPRPVLPTFSSGKEKDFALLKMALDNLIDVHPHLTEPYKYQVLLGKLSGNIKRLAEAFIHEAKPYTAALQALKERYGQPRQLIQSEINSILSMPPVKYNDNDAFENFSLSVHSLVGMLKSLEGENGYELKCGSHVDRLLSKLPSSYRDRFVEHCISRDIIKVDSNNTYTLLHFANWLQTKSRARRIVSQATAIQKSDNPSTDKKDKHFQKRNAPATAVFVTNETPTMPPSTNTTYSGQKGPNRPKAYCPKCNETTHYLNSCTEFKQLTTEQIINWIKEKNRCWRCGRSHKPENCTLKKPCNTCKEQHLTALHAAIQSGASKVYVTEAVTQALFIDQPSRPHHIMLKVVKVLLHGPGGMIETYAILDDGSMRTMILMPAVQALKLSGVEDNILLATVRSEPFLCAGKSVNLQVSPRDNSDVRYPINGAFAANNLCLSEYSYPVEALKKRWSHLRQIPLPPINKACPLILIGSDYADLIHPIQPVRFGPRGAPLAVCTKLGWSLQGPANLLQSQSEEQQCLFTTTLQPTTDLLKNVERLWQADILPYSEKQVTRSKQDKQAIATLEEKTIRIEIDGVQRYATPLLRTKDDNKFRATKEAVMQNLKRNERRLQKHPDKAEIHNKLIQTLVDTGFVKIISNEEALKTEESWYIPHHVVEHNGKHRLVFNCSYEYEGKILNNHLLPGPTQGASLLGVFLRFRQHPVAISGDIQAMFHQVRLLPEDKPLLRFVWRKMNRDVEPDIYEWQVLPFGTTCSPCCATFALRKHVSDDKDVCSAVDQAFYVDNCLDSKPTISEAKELVMKMRKLLSTGGFNIRQWASNIPSVVDELPSNARSEGYELWLAFGQNDLSEGTLGLRWQCSTDELSYKHRSTEYSTLNLRTIYKILASQYDPIGYISPFTARAKVLVQDLWKTKRDWDDPLEPGKIRDQWLTWEEELSDLPLVKLPRCYTPPDVNTVTSNRELHVFCDASERVYGSVAYLRTEDDKGNVSVSFLMSRSRVAPKRQLSMPRLELSAALTGAQLADLLRKELTLEINKVTLWSDSTTVLQWLKSESCRYKVFVGTRVTEIQTLTDVQDWRYVDTQNNPADDITRGKSLKELSEESRWKTGPLYLRQPPSQWPKSPITDPTEDATELKKATFCGKTAIVENPLQPDLHQYNSWDALVEAFKLSLHGVAKPGDDTAQLREDIENLLYQKCQLESFPEELSALKAKRGIPSGSKLSQLDPAYDETAKLIRVGGRLRRAEILSDAVKYPIVLDPQHHITKLIIRDYDEKLLHYGPERILAELRRKFWILRGREAIRRHQHQCFECRKWRAKPEVPKMGDLPPSRLRLFKPAFYSTGVDCFGPMHVKIGRRSEKRWGVIFKCMTTRAIHIDLLEGLDTDAFLMSFRRFISRRGKPYELLSDCGTNFKGAETELQEAFHAMKPDLAAQLGDQKVRFKFNPPSAPHFGGVWEREIKSIKDGLKVVIKDQSVTEAVLRTVLIEIEGILNSKPLGYISSDVADINPITPNILLMGRHDQSLPQVVYPVDELIGRRRWRHSQVLADQFWSHFLKYYLPSLQLRPKWQKDCRNLTCGDVVMIADPQQPRAHWLVGRVIETLPGVDDRIRAARVKVADREYTRPVARLIRLPEITDSEDP
ncbi:uncharacterized protein LOC117298338 [Asterias rubens]|uniref:uncharacterized protein LOC117298338 n=1 Tax=Asterias rubens TaxID=7604 RepID=UPI0014554E28|nr:uncharacterized protein LOC117298338 [Asterias rubens]